MRYRFSVPLVCAVRSSCSERTGSNLIFEGNKKNTRIPKVPFSLMFLAGSKTILTSHNEKNQFVTSRIIMSTTRMIPMSASGRLNLCDL